MNKLEIRDLGESSHNPKFSFGFTSTKDDKGKENYDALRWGQFISVASLSIQQLQDMITNTI